MKQVNRSNGVWFILILGSFLTLYLLIQAGIIDAVYEMTLSQIGINIIAAVGLNLILGVSGQFSLGHAGFMAIGAYAIGVIYPEDPTFKGFILSMLVGMLLSGGVALLVGIPTLRLKGDYLAIATLGVSEMIRVIINNLEISIGTSGISGMPYFDLFRMLRLIFSMVILSEILILMYSHMDSGRA